ncbi:FAD-dependent oxidoreductase [Jannaschia sp. Os4]|uniref:NAD(P)/FAD-dependent oxidoreductase n=1 Tax=Jannaschia sp. Os4 TaxID=2807617 RepID=UPI00193AD8CE|nr:FAD-dependent oxidoreductase [Jannaschia sp. Os4]MBM2577379.1 FAD-dependent oxidoreductase [Jannaschia sp. Os4]
MDRFEFCVVGGGMMGSACARWLAEGGSSVVLVQPPEGEGGVVASHWDAARITRRVAADADWATLSRRSIDRYADIAARSGVEVFTPSGAVMAGPRTGPLAGWTEGFLSVAAAVPGTEVTNGREANARFGFGLAPDDAVSVEAGGGWIAPRAMKAAQTRLAVAAGAVVAHGPAVAVADGRVALADGSVVEAGQVVVATGPHAGTDRLLPRRPAMTVWARTIALARVPDEEAARLAGMPTVIWVPEGWDHDLYMTPPVCYPDGGTWLKLGGQVDSPRLASDAEMRDWYAGTGSAEVGDRLLAEMRAVLPGLAAAETRTAACAVVWTETGFPYVERIGERLTALVGGNGAAAKCGDELGRLGAAVARGGSLDGEGYATDFAGRWAARP